MTRANEQAANDRAMDDLRDSLATMHQPNSWRQTLKAYAARGYPTGQDSPGGGTGINRPTERIALAPLEEPAAKLKRADEIAHTLRTLARELNSIRLYTITPAAYNEPEPIPCRNLACPNIMERHKGESPRDGRCPRCATHHRRYGLEYPNKHLNTNDTTGPAITTNVTQHS